MATLVLFLNRDTSDGTLVEFRKDGTTVGSIGAGSSELIIGTADTGLRFYDFGDAIIPRSTSNGARDATTDLGASSNRFKDLYLSGGVNFSAAGGTGTATSNLLDDYEEGSFTATLTSAVAPTSPPTASGRYTKIGRSVTVSIFLKMQIHRVGRGLCVSTDYPLQLVQQLETEGQAQFIL
jgi:hypothetical protein